MRFQLTPTPREFEGVLRVVERFVFWKRIGDELRVLERACWEEQLVRSAENGGTLCWFPIRWRS